MYGVELTQAFETTVTLSMSAAFVIGLVLALRAPARGPTREAHAPTLGSRLAAVVLHPLAQFLLVCGLLYVNQVLFGAYILRAHGGSTDFIARHISFEWFAIGTQDPFVQLAARHVGNGRWLSPTLLRVQAFLELPFTLFAYLAVARLLGRGLYLTLCKPWVLVLASLSFSVTFSLVELSVPNPFTRDDLFLRAIACLVMPVYCAWIARLEESRRTTRADGPSGALGLLAFLAGAGGIAYAVLAFYDAFLLYNLAHLPRHAEGLVMALGIAVLASVAIPHIDRILAKASFAGPSPSLAMDTAVSALRVFTVLFFVPSLAVRYLGAHPIAALSGALLIVLGSVGGAALALRRASAAPDFGAADVARFVLAATCALGAGGWVSHGFLREGAAVGMAELLLLRVALSFLVTAIVVFRAVEIAVCWAVHETKAQADEA